MTVTINPAMTGASSGGGGGGGAVLPSVPEQLFSFTSTAKADTDLFTAGVARDSAGNLYAIGSDVNAGTPLLVKYSAAGVIVWAKAIAGPLAEYSVGDCVAVDSLDNVYAMLTQDEVGFCVLTKFTSAGVEVWQKKVDLPGAYMFSAFLEIGAANRSYMVVTVQDPTDITRYGVSVIVHEADGTFIVANTYYPTAPYGGSTVSAGAFRLTETGEAFLVINTEDQRTMLVLKYIFLLDQPFPEVTRVATLPLTVDEITASTIAAKSMVYDGSAFLYIAAQANIPTPAQGTPPQLVVVKFRVTDGTVAWASRVTGTTADVADFVEARASGMTYNSDGTITVSADRRSGPTAFTRSYLLATLDDSGATIKRIYLLEPDTPLEALYYYASSAITVVGETVYFVGRRAGAILFGAASRLGFMQPNDGNLVAYENDIDFAFLPITVGANVAGGLYSASGNGQTSVAGDFVVSDYTFDTSVVTDYAVLPAFTPSFDEFGRLEVRGVALSDGTITRVPSNSSESSSAVIATIAKTLRPLAAPATAIGNVGDYKNAVAIDATYFYYCTANYDGATPIWLRAPWTAW